jgi:hypothetical protein
MPNHVTNKVEITSTNAQEALSFMHSDARSFDFNNVIPMPESLNIESGTVTDAALAYYLTDGLTKAITADQIEEYYKEEYFSSKAEQVERAVETAQRCLDKDLQTHEQLLELGKKVVLNIHTYNCQTWYEWSPQNWGTKWNAYDITVSENQVKFDTAWNSPVPVLDAWIAKFNLTCTVKAFDEGHNFWFIKTYEDGILKEFRDSEKEDCDALCKELKGYNPSDDEEEGL